MQIEIHAHDVPLTEDLRAHVERRFQFAVGRFQDQLLSVIVRLSDINGPRGGVDKHCQAQIRLRGLPKIVIKDTEADVYVAVDRAADRSGRTLARNLQRAQRMDFVTCWVES